MKWKVKGTTLTLVLAWSLTACRSGVDSMVAEEEDTRRGLGMTLQEYRRFKQERPLLQMGREYPFLLPPERPHKVLVELQHVPKELGERDVADISLLAGRVPGLSRYELRVIRKSTMYLGCYDVSIMGALLTVKKENGDWVVYRIDGMPVP